MGFEGASPGRRQEANVQHQLILLPLARRALMVVMDELATVSTDWRTHPADPRGRCGHLLRLVVREFVKYSAENPQLHRLMTMEAARRANARPGWSSVTSRVLCDQYKAHS